MMHDVSRGVFVRYITYFVAFIDPCNGVDCGNGTCSPDDDNQPECICDAGSALYKEVCVAGG